MKRIYATLGLLVSLVTGAFAQKNIDLGVTILRPDSTQQYDNVATGDSFLVGYVLTNNGTDDVTATDTLIFYHAGQFVYNGDYYWTSFGYYGLSIPAGTSDTIPRYIVQGKTYSNGGEDVIPTNDTFFYDVMAFGLDGTNTLFTDPDVNNDTLLTWLNGGSISSLGSLFTNDNPNNYAYNWGVFGTETGVGNISGLPKEALNVYPNPTKGNLTISYNFKAATNATIRVTDIAGRVVMVKDLGKRSAGNQLFNINLGSLPNGNYFVELGTDKARAISQVIVNN